MMKKVRSIVRRADAKSEVVEEHPLPMALRRVLGAMMPASSQVTVLSRKKMGAIAPEILGAKKLALKHVSNEYPIRVNGEFDLSDWSSMCQPYKYKERTKMPGEFFGLKYDREGIMCFVVHK